MRNYVNIILILLIFLVSAAEAEKLTLAETVRIALEKNPEIRSAQNRYESAKALISPSYALPDPHIGADFERIPAGSADLRQAEMRFYNLSQTIPWPGMLIGEGQAAYARAEMAGNFYRAKEREIVKKVKTAYYDLAKTDEVIKIMTSAVSIMEQAYDSARSRYSVGKGFYLEAVKMRLELKRMENDLENMRDERSVKNLTLNLLLNTATDEVMEIVALPSTESFDYSYEKFVELALVHAPDLKMEESALEEAQAMVGSARASYFPETMVKWRSQKTGDNIGANDLMFDFSVPLWFPLRQNREVEAAEKTVRARTAAYQSAKNILRGEIKMLLTAVKIAERKAKLYDTALLSSARSALESALSGYRAGKTDFLNFADTERTYLEINKEYYETLSAYFIKRAELEERVGVDFEGSK